MRNLNRTRVCVAAVALCVMTDAQALVIPAGMDFDTAIRRFVEATDLSVIYEAGRLDGFYTMWPVYIDEQVKTDRRTKAKQLRELLKDTGLVATFTTDHFIAITVKPPRKLTPWVEPDCSPALSVSGELLGPWCREAGIDTPVYRPDLREHP